MNMFLKTSEVADQLGVCDDTIRAYVHNQKLKFAFKTDGGQMRFTQENVDEYVNQRDGTSKNTDCLEGGEI